MQEPDKAATDGESVCQCQFNNPLQLAARVDTQSGVHTCEGAHEHVKPDFTKSTNSTPAAEQDATTRQFLTDIENGRVGWDAESDPENPLNFTPSQKWLMTGLLSTIGLMTPFASSIIAPAIAFLQKDFGEDSVTKAALPVSIFLLGYAVGPLILSPLSELYGRHIVITSASAFFCIWLIGCALAPSLSSLAFFRFLCGVGGSASQTVGGAIIGDLFSVHERGRALGIWMLGPILGPSLAPVIGGFVAETIGWRWANWITLIPAAFAVAAMAVFNRETNHRVLIERKTAKMRKQLGRPELYSCYAESDMAPSSKRAVILRGITRPLRMLFRSAILFGISLYIAFAYGCLYLLFNTIPIVFQDQYGWSLGLTGVVYLALLIGYILGLVILFNMSDKTVVRMTKANGGVYEPEMRLPVCNYFAWLLPISFFWYGWSSERGAPWVVPVLGLVVFGVGFECIWLPSQAFVVDAYPKYSASALAAFSVMRSVVAAFLPLAGPQMYQALGIGWGNTVLGLIAVALVPVSLLIYRFGKAMRRHEDWEF